MPAPAPMHLAVALDGAGWHPAAWREPQARPAELFTAGYWIDQIQQAERGLTPRPPQGQPVVSALAHHAVPYRLVARSADIGTGTLRGLVGLSRPASRYATA